jgi:ketol-acid reductoisomerase
MTRILRDADADPAPLRGEAVGVVGFGNQGGAQAACLREAGHEVLVVVREAGASAARARAEGFSVHSPSELRRCGVIAVLVPDEVQPEIAEAWIHPHARSAALLVFAHGFALREGRLSVREDLDVAIVAPLGPGSLLRERFRAGTGLAGLLAVVRDASGSATERALAYARALRLTRAGVFPTTLDEEVVSDLFAEQAVLVGGAVELMRAAWEVLVEDGISPEIAYYSCVQELKQILDLVHEAGPAGMRRLTSATARYGGLTRGPRVVGEAARAEMRRMLAEVRSGRFAAEWMRERERGSRRLSELAAAEAEHPMEEAGRTVRGEAHRPPATAAKRLTVKGSDPNIP